MKSMPFLAIISFLILTSCKLNTQNSNSADKALAVGSCDALPSNEARFCNSQNIIRTRCISCHTGYHNNYANFDERDYIDNLLVIPADADNSLLIQRLFNAGGNMPQGGSNIPDEDYQELRQWVNAL